MSTIKKHPMIMIVIGVLGISLSAIFVRYSKAPSSVTAAYRLLWTILLMSPVMLGKKNCREELFQADRKTVALSGISGVFLAIHFTLWFESLKHTSVASSTAIVCTEVVWVAIGYCLFMKGKLSFKEGAAIAAALVGSGMIAWSDSAAGLSGSVYGDLLSLLSAMAVAVYMLLGRAAREKMSTGVYTYIVYCFSAGTLLIITAASGTSMTGWGPSGVITGFLLAVFSTLLGHSIFSWCLKYFSPAFVSASKLCEPAAASFMAWILFGEVPAVLQAAGGVVIVGAVLYYSGLENQKKEEESV